MRLSVRELEERVGALAGRNYFSQELLYDLLTAYGRSASSMTRLRKGDSECCPAPGEGRGGPEERGVFQAGAAPGFYG